MKKKAEEQVEEKPQYYTVKLDVIAPVELTFKIWAKNPQEAIEKCDRAPIASTPKLRNRGRKKKAVVYRSNYSNIELQKNF